MKVGFRDAIIIRDGMKPLYDIASRCYLQVHPTHLLFQAMNPERSIGINCEFPNSVYTPLSPTTTTSGKFDLTKVFTQLKMHAQKNDRLQVEIATDRTGKLRFSMYLQRSVSFLQQQQLAQQNLMASLRKRKRVRKEQVLHMDRKDTPTGEEQTLWICSTPWTASTRLVQFPNSFRLAAVDRAVLHLPSIELQTQCGELAVIGPLVTIMIPTAQSPPYSSDPNPHSTTGSSSNTGSSTSSSTTSSSTSSSSTSRSTTSSSTSRSTTSSSTSSSSSGSCNSSNSTSSSSTSDQRHISFSASGCNGKMQFQFFDRHMEEDSSAVAIPLPMCGYQQTFSLQLILFCMQIFSQCKYVTLFLLRDSPLVLFAETNHGVRYYVYITPAPPASLVPPPSQGICGQDTAVTDCGDSVCSNETDGKHEYRRHYDAEQDRDRERGSHTEMMGIGERVDLSGLHSSAFRPHAKLGRLTKKEKTRSAPPLKQKSTTSRAKKIPTVKV